MYNRNIQKRIETLTPFLSLDKDPYLVIDDEKGFEKITFILNQISTPNNSIFHNILNLKNLIINKFLRNN